MASVHCANTAAPEGPLAAISAYLSDAVNHHSVMRGGERKTVRKERKTKQKRENGREEVREGVDERANHI